MRMIHTLVVAAILAVTPSGMAPLPAQYLQAAMFNSPDGWFSIHSPQGSEWFEMRTFDGDADPRWPDGAHHSVALYIRNPKMPGAVVLMESYAADAPMLDDSYLDGLEGDVRKTHPNETISGFSAVLITQPVEGIRYSFARSKSGSTRYHFWYATGWEHKVFLHADSPTPAEPKWLREMAQSFRWLKMP
jgi:hypothetical protein